MCGGMWCFTALKVDLLLPNCFVGPAHVCWTFSCLAVETIYVHIHLYAGLPLELHVTIGVTFVLLLLALTGCSNVSTVGALRDISPTHFELCTRVGKTCTCEVASSHLCNLELHSYSVLPWK